VCEDVVKGGSSLVQTGLGLFLFSLIHNYYNVFIKRLKGAFFMAKSYA